MECVKHRRCEMQHKTWPIYLECARSKSRVLQLNVPLIWHAESPTRATKQTNLNIQTHYQTCLVEIIVSF